MSTTEGTNTTGIYELSDIGITSTDIPPSEGTLNLSDGQLGSVIVGSVITNGTLFTSGTPLSISDVTITPGVWILLGQVVFTIASVSTSPVLIGHAISLGQSNTAMALLCSNEDIVSETVALSNVISKQVTRILAVNGTYTYNLMALNTFSNCTISVNAAASNLTALRIA